MPLPGTALRNAEPKDKPYRLADERGLCLEVRTEGGKWWRLRYRFDAKAKMLSLGSTPTSAAGSSASTTSASPTPVQAKT